MCLGCSQERLHAICAPTLAEAAAGLRAHGQTGYLLRVLPSGERTAIRQAGTRRGSCAQEPEGAAIVPSLGTDPAGRRWSMLHRSMPRDANQRATALTCRAADRASSFRSLFQPSASALSQRASAVGWPFLT